MAAVYFTGEGAHDGRENWAVARRVLILYGAHLSLHERIGTEVINRDRRNPNVHRRLRGTWKFP